MSTTTTELTLTEVLTRPPAPRVHAAVHHLSMVLGYAACGPYHVAEQRRELEQAIAELQAAQAELDPPVAGTD